MSSGNKITIQSISPFQKSPPFDMSIAKYTGIGRAAGQVFINKILYHKRSEFITDIQDIMRKTMLHSSHAGVVEGIKIAATCFFFRTAAGSVIPGFHGNTYHLIALLVEHEGCYGTVDTATHCYQNFS